MPNSAHAQLIDSLTDIESVDALDGVHAEVVEQTQSNLAAGMDALDVCAAIAGAHERLTTRLIELAENHLGPPPCDYVWMALGSHGRGEQVLSSDQDSAIAFQPNGIDPDSAKRYFVDLAELVVPRLARAGLPECDGGYMAHRWCHPIGFYSEIFRGWVEKPNPTALLRVEVFLDVRAFHGGVSTKPLDDVLLVGGRRGPFKAQMATAGVSFAPPLGFFGQFKTVSGGIDVKSGGTAPIVLLARLYALVAQSAAKSTAQRLADAAAAGVLASSTAQDLADSYRFLTELRLRHQADQAAENIQLDNIVQRDWLTDDQKSTLRDAFRTVKAIQQVTSTTYATNTLL